MPHSFTQYVHFSGGSPAGIARRLGDHRQPLNPATPGLMKPQSIFFAIIAGTILFPCAIRAQYAVGWFTIDGGGGVSSGAGYSVAGTVGQPDAGTMGGGAFTLVGGFWSLFTPAPTTPSLRITLIGTNALVSWPNPSPGFTLEETPTLTGPIIPWSNVSQTPTVVGSDQQVTVPAKTGNRFYRLKK